jgi:hypothetical protein
MQMRHLGNVNSTTQELLNDLYKKAEFRVPLRCAVFYEWGSSMT